MRHAVLSMRGVSLPLFSRLNHRRSAGIKTERQPRPARCLFVKTSMLRPTQMSTCRDAAAQHTETGFRKGPIAALSQYLNTWPGG